MDWKLHDIGKEIKIDTKHVDLYEFVLCKILFFNRCFSYLWLYFYILENSEYIKRMFVAPIYFVYLKYDIFFFLLNLL